MNSRKSSIKENVQLPSFDEQMSLKRTLEQEVYIKNEPVVKKKRKMVSLSGCFGGRNEIKNESKSEVMKQLEIKENTTKPFTIEEQSISEFRIETTEEQKGLEKEVTEKERNVFMMKTCEELIELYKKEYTQDEIENLIKNDKVLTENIIELNKRNQIELFDRLRNTYFEREQGRNILQTIGVDIVGLIKENFQSIQNADLERVKPWKNGRLWSDEESSDVIKSKQKKWCPVETNFWRNDFCWEKQVEHIIKTNNENTSFDMLKIPLINGILSGHHILLSLLNNTKKINYFEVINQILIDKYVIVISPTIKQMEDDNIKLSALGIKTIVINSNNKKAVPLLENEIKEKKMEHKFLFTTIDMLIKNNKFETCIDLLRENGLLGMVIIDEAHCVTQWGHSYKTSYMKIKDMREKWDDIQIGMITTTCIPTVYDDIMLSIGLDEVVTINEYVFRPNLIFEVRPKDTKKIDEDIVSLIKNNHSNQSGIIFCSCKQECEWIEMKLNKEKIKSIVVWPQMKNESKEANQDIWLKDESLVMCCTNLFGIGIEKENVRFVIQRTLPEIREQYYLNCEMGGRDGQQCRCILFSDEVDGNEMGSTNKLMEEDTLPTKQVDNDDVNSVSDSEESIETSESVDNKEIDELQEQIKKIEEERDQYQQEIKEMEEKNKQLMVQFEQTKASEKKRVQLLKKKEKENEEIKKEREKLIKKIEEIQQIVEAEKKEIELQNEEIKRIIDEREKIKENKQLLKEEKERILQQSQQREIELKKELEDKVNDFNQKIDQMKKEKDLDYSRFIDSYNKYEDKIIKMNNTINELTEQIDKHKQFEIFNEKEYDKSLFIQRHENEKLNKEIQKLNQFIQSNKQSSVSTYILVGCLICSLIANFFL